MPKVFLCLMFSLSAFLTSACVESMTGVEFGQAGQKVEADMSGGESMAGNQTSEALSTRIPLIDRNAPKTTELATFALG